MEKLDVNNLPRCKCGSGSFTFWCCTVVNGEVLVNPKSVVECWSCGETVDLDQAPKKVAPDKEAIRKRMKWLEGGRCICIPGFFRCDDCKEYSELKATLEALDKEEQK